MEALNSLIGEKGKYLYKQAGESFTIDAKVVEAHGAHILIEFINPKGFYRHRRWLRTPAERARFTTDMSYEVKRRGGQAGNHNAEKDGPRRVLITLSLKDERLIAMMKYLQAQGKDSRLAHLRELAYEGIDVLMHESRLRD